LFTVFSHSFYQVISTGGEGKLAPFNAIHYVGTKWKWVVHLKTPSLYPQIRNLWWVAVLLGHFGEEKNLTPLLGF